jgi:uncharacterized protein YbjT (DUF2867 family)
MMSSVFVTGATGTVGSSVVEHLLARGERVVAGVRDPGTDSARLPSGAEPRRFAFGSDPGQLDAALEGTDRLFLMRPPPIEDVQTYLFPVVDAARRRGVRQIVFLSLQGVQANRRTPHHAVEKYLRESGAPFTNLRPNFFMQNLSTIYAQEIRESGEIAVPAGRSRTAFIDARDIGRVAAGVFTSPGHERCSYTLSGTESLTYEQVARTMSDVLGRTITYTRPSEEEYLHRLAAQGLPQDYIDVQKMIYRVVRMNISALPNRSVQKLTGDTATTFRQFVHDHRHVWAPGEPS